jgi:hypothetical protein
VQYSKKQRVAQTKPFQFLNLKSGQMQDASWEMVGQLHGVSWMPNSGESPSVAVESSLSQILEANAPEKYYLSQKACSGILRRAERRGKDLPPMLKEALMEVLLMNQDKDTGCPELAV